MMAEEEYDENMNSDTEGILSSSSSSSSSSESEEEPKTEKITLKARKDRGSRGKWKLLSEKKSFKKEWLTMYLWVEEDPRNPLLANCKICKTSIKASKNTIESHQRSKKHIKKVASILGSDFSEEPKKDDPKVDPKPSAVGIDQITDEQISYFAESQADAAHQAVTSVIDKLVEKYHENRVINLKIQNDAKFQLNAERAKIVRTMNQKKLERRLQHEAFMKEMQDTHIKCLITEHESKIHSMEGERDAKLRAVEQELVFAKQEYEKKVRLLDSQLSSMK